MNQHPLRKPVYNSEFVMFYEVFLADGTQLFHVITKSEVSVMNFKSHLWVCVSVCMCVSFLGVLKLYIQDVIIF